MKSPNKLKVQLPIPVMTTDDELIERMWNADELARGHPRSHMRAILAVVREYDGRDGERYRWLRSNVQWGYPSPEGSDNPDAYLVITGYGHHYGKPTAVNAVDAAVDAAIARMKG